jgi:PST family polysaccharide transporter
MKLSLLSLQANFFSPHSRRRVVLNNTFFQLAARLFSAFNSLITTITISRFLGVATFGDLVKVISFTTLFYMPLDFGFNAVAVKLYASKSVSAVLPQLFLLRVCLSLFLVGLSIIISHLLPGTVAQGFTPTVKFFIAIFSLTIIYQGLIQTLNSFFQFTHSYHYSFIGEFINNSLLFVFLFISLVTRSLNPLIYGYVVSAFATVTILYLLVKPKIHLVLGINLKLLKSIFIPSIPLGIALIFNLLATKIDLPILTSYRPTTEVAFYGLAKRIFEIVLMVPIFFANSLYPFMLRSADQKLLRKSLQTMLVVAICLSLLIILLSPLVILIKPEFAATIPILRFLSLLLPIYFLTAPLMWYVIARGKNHLLIPVYFCQLCFSLLFNFLLIPKFGIPGAMTTTFLVESIVLVCLILIVKPIHTS